jgi:hypothetical protein
MQDSTIISKATGSTTAQYIVGFDGNRISSRFGSTNIGGSNNFATSVGLPVVFGITCNGLLLKLFGPNYLTAEPALLSSPTVTDSSLANTTPIRLGCTTPTVWNANGYLFELSIWHQTATDAQIINIMKIMKQKYGLV